MKEFFSCRDYWELEMKICDESNQQTHEQNESSKSTTNNTTIQNEFTLTHRLLSL